MLRCHANTVMAAAVRPNRKMRTSGKTLDEGGDGDGGLPRSMAEVIYIGGGAVW